MRRGGMVKINIHGSNRVPVVDQTAVHKELRLSNNVCLNEGATTRMIVTIKKGDHAIRAVKAIQLKTRKFEKELRAGRCVSCVPGLGATVLRR